MKFDTTSMTFTVYENGMERKIGFAEAHEYLSETQIQNAIQAKIDDPFEEVSYMIPNGFIVLNGGGRYYLG